MRKKTTVLLLVLLAIFLVWAPAEALATNPADTLTINVGYHGGPYYQKKVFTVDELTSLGLISADYSYIDQMPSVCLDHAKGVPISTIIKAAGIDLNSVQRFYFYTKDKEGGYWTDFTKSSLLEQTRYYYPNLVFRYYEPDFFPGEYDEQAAAGAIPVPAMMAVSDNWVRHLPGPDNFGIIDRLTQTTAERFRLLFGQTDTWTNTASRSAKWVHSINVTLGGSPSIEIKDPDPEKEVGSEYQLEVTIIADDDLVAEYIREGLEFQSSDESIATIDKYGNVKILRPGYVEFTVFYGEKKHVVSTKHKIKAIPGNPSHDDGNASQTKNPQEQTDNKKSAGINLPSGGGGKGTIAGMKAIKISGLGAAKKMGAKALANSVFALRLGNVNKSEGLLSALAGGEKDKHGQGAVQNWRETEMADTAEALGRIEESVPVKTVLFGALAIMLVSIAGRLAEFYLEI